MTPPSGPQVAPWIASGASFVGRSKEREQLSQAVRQAQEGRGSTWLVEAPAGMGKTRLVRWVQEHAEKEGFRTLWSYALKEVRTPLFSLEQLFRSLSTPPSEELLSRAVPSPLSSVLLFEEERPQLLYEVLARISAGRPCLVVGRDRPEVLGARLQAMNCDARVLWLSKGPGEGRISPESLDKLGDLLRKHFEAAPGSIVGLSGLDYLVSQHSFGPVLRLVQFLRDAAEEQNGHLLLALRSSSFERREVGLIESEGHVVRPPPPTPGPVSPAPPAAPESPTTTMIHFLDTLEREAPRRPLLLILDDLQWADPSSLRAFQFLARNLRKLRVAMLATRRSGETSAPEEPKEPSVESVLDAMTQEGTVHRLELDGLSAEEAAELARGLFGVPLARGSRNEGLLQIWHRSGGNPYYLNETLRQLSEAGYVSRADDGLRLTFEREGRGGEKARPSVPDSLRRLVARRLEQLSSAQREVLRWGAVVGVEFDSAPIQAVAPLSGEALASALEQLEGTQRLLEVRDPRAGWDRWSFTHPLVWEVAIEELKGEEGRRRAKLLADWWAECRPDDPDTVARLYHDAMDASGGVPWVRKALEMAVKARALELVERDHRWLQEFLSFQEVPVEARVHEGLAVAVRLIELAGTSREVASILRNLLDLGPQEVQRGEVEAQLAHCLVLLSPPEARALLRKLQGEGTGVPVSATARAAMGLTSARLAMVDGRHVEAEAEASRVLGLGQGTPVWVRVMAACYSAQSLARLGRPEEARERLREARAIAEPKRDPRLRGLLWNAETIVSECAGDVAASCKAAEATLAMHREVGNPPSIASGIYNHAYALMLEGDLPAARRALEEFRRHCDRFHDDREAVFAPLLEGRLLLMEGRWEEARARLQESADEMVRSGRRDQLNNVRIDLTDARASAGEVSQARREAEKIRGSGNGLTADERHTLAMIEGRCEAAEGRREAAQGCFQEARAMADGSGNVFNQAMARNHLARWEEAFGSPERAQALWAEARALFDRSGVLPEGWARRWPPPLRPGPSAFS